VTIELFTVHGKKFATIFDGEHEPGEFSIPFSAATYGITSGINFIRVSTNNQRQTFKIVQMKE